MLPKLYSRRSDGKLQEWSVEVKGCQYRFHSGIKDGEIVTSEFTTCKGKNLGRSNETTPEQQAELEARSHWQKKVDKGYRADQTEVDDIGFFEPMLAKEYKVGGVTFPVYAQPKLDGVRCIVTAKGMFSRNGKPNISAPHIRAALEPIFRKNPDAIFDGELYADKFANDFNTIISLAKQGKPTEDDLARSAELLQYHIYDFPGVTGTFSERWRALGLTMNGFKHRSIVGVTTHKVTTQERLDALYGEWVEAGYEGQMVRVDAPYENKRTKVLLKRKEFQDAEYIVLDVEEGDGNRSGMAGKMVFRTAGDREFRANIKGNRELYRQILAEKKKYIGKPATVKFFNLTPDGVPRFPVVIKFDK